MKKIKATEPNCLTELTTLKHKSVIYHQDTIDRLVKENVKIKETYEVALQEIYQICENTFYLDDREAITNIMQIIEGVLHVQ